jgi:hypothetical protein
MVQGSLQAGRLANVLSICSPSFMSVNVWKIVTECPYLPVPVISSDSAESHRRYPLLFSCKKFTIITSSLSHRFGSWFSYRYCVPPLETPRLKTFLYLLPRARVQVRVESLYRENARFLILITRKQHRARRGKIRFLSTNMRFNWFVPPYALT